jgi:hypothetical protein
MKTKDLTKNLHIWRNNDEQELLNKINGPKVLESFEERDRTIIEGLIRKNLLIKVQGKHSTYVYPTD